MIANVLQPLIDVFEALMRFFHDNVGLGWGFSIIAMTIVVRALLAPLTVRQFKSMAAMQRIAPEMKKLQERYKDDKQRQQQELMALYKEHKVNPFGSCLPLVAQMPVFISLYYMLRHDLRHDICPKINPANIANPRPCGASHSSEFLFIHDITDKATGGVLIVLIVLYIGSQLLSSLLMSQQVADKNQRFLMIGLPFLFTTFIIRFPAGLIVYWITTNLWTVGQSYLLRRRLGHLRPDPALAPAGGGLFELLSGKKKEPEAAPAAPVAKGEKAPRTEPPPRPPRQKKKRSGRRR